MTSAAISEQPTHRMSFKPTWMGKFGDGGGGGGRFNRNENSTDSQPPVTHGSLVNAQGHGMMTIG